MITARSRSFPCTALVPLAIGACCCILAAGRASADLAPWFNNVRPTEMFVLATSADDPALRARLLALSPAVSPDEAQRVAECAYNTGRELAREWRVVSLPGVQNFLVNTGARKGGLCFQYATELLIRLDALKLQTLDLHWAEAYPRTGAEHNVIVVTAKGQPFQKGVILDNWRYQGHLVYCWVMMDTQYRWKENRGELVRRLNAIPTATAQTVATGTKRTAGVHVSTGAKSKDFSDSNHSTPSFLQKNSWIR